MLLRLLNRLLGGAFVQLLKVEFSLVMLTARVWELETGVEKG
jgi:hypothetical protein